jgi:hypothetical protein
MKLAFLLAVLMLSQLFSVAQSQKINTHIEFGGVRGIQLSKTFPILKSGGLAQFNVSKSFGNYVQLGLGTAYIQLEDEEFIPLFLYARASKKSEGNSFYFNTSVGYARASNLIFESAVYSQYVGKMYFSPGMGYYYNISPKWGLTAGINYILQKVDLEHYNTNYELYYTESLTLDLIVFKFGVTLH